MPSASATYSITGREPFVLVSRVGSVLGMGFIAHHLIQFTREALRGEQNASYYSTKLRAPSEPALSSAAELPPLRRSA